MTTDAGPASCPWTEGEVAVVLRQLAEQEQGWREYLHALQSRGLVEELFQATGIDMFDYVGEIRTLRERVQESVCELRERGELALACADPEWGAALLTIARSVAASRVNLRVAWATLAETEGWDGGQ